MNKAFALLQQKNKQKIKQCERMTGGKYRTDMEKEKLERSNQLLKAKEELDRRQKIQMFKEAQKELPDVDNDPEIRKLLDKQLKDDWSLILSQFQQQLEATHDLRCEIAGPEVYEPNDNDDQRVKFFKGIFKSLIILNA